MAALVVILLLFAWGVWVSRPLAPQPRPRSVVVPDPVDVLPPRHDEVRVPAHAPRARPSVSPDCPTRPLTEDDLIAFGRALETTDDVVGDLLGPVA